MMSRMIIYIKKEQTISRLGKLLLYAGMILVLIILPGCNNEKGDSSVQNDKIKPSSYAVTDDTGLTLQFTEKPKRIVSYSISTDEILMALVKPERIAALSRLVDDPGVSSIVEEAKQIPARVQGNAAEILTTGGRVSGVKTLTGEKEKGEAVIAKMEARIQQVQQRLANIPASQRKRVIQLRSEGAFYAPDNSFGDVCRHAGVSDATLELKYPSAMEITQEKVVELNPDIIFVPDWDYDGKHNPDGERRKILNNPSYRGMKAVQQGKVYTISGALVLTVSQYIADAVEEVAKMSYPEVFGKS